MVQANAGVVQIDINDYVDKDDSGEENIAKNRSRQSERVEGGSPRLAEGDAKAQNFAIFLVQNQIKLKSYQQNNVTTWNSG